MGRRDGRWDEWTMDEWMNECPASQDEPSQDKLSVVVVCCCCFADHLPACLPCLPSTPRFCILALNRRLGRCRINSAPSLSRPNLHYQLLNFNDNNTLTSTLLLSLFFPLRLLWLVLSCFCPCSAFEAQGTRPTCTSKDRQQQQQQQPEEREQHSSEGRAGM